MIYNMHIRNDFDRWIETPKKRVTTLCGKITATKFAGIPGISEGQGAYVSDGGKDVGWCIKCCRNFLEEYDNNDFLYSLKNRHLWYLYTDAIHDLILQVQLFIKATSPN
jgi:hypothetical protein